MKRNTKLGLVLGAGLMVAAGAAARWSPGVLTGPGREGAKPKAASAIAQMALPPAVTVARAVLAEFVETVLVSGSLVPREEVLVGPEIEGLRIIEVLAEEGDQVRQGQVLARLVRDTLDAQMAQSDAGLVRADAAIAQARSQIEQAEATVHQAQADFERAKPLRNSGALTQQVFEQREMLARTAASKLIAANDGLKLALADKAQTEAQRRELVWKMGKTEITAPADAIVSRRNARVGQMSTGAGEPVFRLIARGEIELEGEVIEGKLHKLRQGQPALVEVAGQGVHKGAVRLVSPEIDKATRLGKVRIFLGADPALRIGSFAKGTIETARSRGVAIPASAVLHGPTGSYAQAVIDGKVATRAIRTGLLAGGLVEVVEGIGEGTLVIARAGTMVRDGDEVRAVPVAKDKSAGLAGAAATLE